MASDNFVGAASTAIDTHDANWTAVSGSGTPQLDGSGNLMEPSINRESYYLYNTATNDSSWVEIPSPASAQVSNLLGGACMRMAGASYGYRAFINTFREELVVAKDGEGNIIIGTLSPSFDTASPIIVGIEFGSFAGSTNIRATAKQGASTQVFLYNDGTPLSAGAPGLYAASTVIASGIAAVSRWDTTELSFAAGSAPPKSLLLLGVG